MKEEGEGTKESREMKERGNFKKGALVTPHELSNPNKMPTA